MTTEPVPVWPGEFVGLPDVGNVFVRSAPALSGNAQPAVFVHGLGGSSTNWTDLMDVLRRPAAGGSKADLPALHGEALDLAGIRLLAGAGRRRLLGRPAGPRPSSG